MESPAAPAPTSSSAAPGVERRSGETGQEPELGNGLAGPHPGHDALRLDDGLVRVRPALDRDGAGRGLASKLLRLEQGGPQGGPEGRGARPGGEGNERGRRRDAFAVLDDEAEAREKTDEASHGRLRQAGAKRELGDARGAFEGLDQAGLGAGREGVRGPHRRVDTLQGRAGPRPDGGRAWGARPAYARDRSPMRSPPCERRA